MSEPRLDDDIALDKDNDEVIDVELDRMYGDED